MTPTFGRMDAAERSVTVVVVPGATALPLSESTDVDLEREEYEADEYDLDLDREEYDEEREYDRSRFLRLDRFTGKPSPCILARSSSE